MDWDALRAQIRQQATQGRNSTGLRGNQKVCVSRVGIAQWIRLKITMKIIKRE